MSSSLGFIQRLRGLRNQRDQLRAERQERRRLREVRRRENQFTERPGLVDYAAALCPPDWERFGYFAPYADALESAIGADLRLCFAAPPQHGKTEFTLRALLYWCEFSPGYRHAYITYNHDRAKEVAEDFRSIAREAGFVVTGTLRRFTIRNRHGKTSVIRFSSVRGSLTGYPIDGVCVVDDYIKDQEAARSKANRAAGIRWWHSVALTRRHVGTSYIVMATRWPGGDLIDHLLKDAGSEFSYINLKAIAEPEGPEDLADDGTVLSDPLGRQQGQSLSARKPPEFFRQDRAKPFWWVAMFQGAPTSEGLRVFAEPGSFDEQGNPIGPGYYSELPKSGYRIGYGVDLAYSARTSADWSILIEGIACDGKLYLISAQRKQVPATSFLLTLVAAKTNRPGALFRFYSGGGGEKGSADFIKQKLGRCFKIIPATADKLVRATPASMTWNLGNILLPDPEVFDVPWLEDFLAVVTTFTGTPGEQDDDVDALAALHDQLMRRSKMLEALSGKPS
jgi:predicted phage terminase large subunit-like protein